MTVRVSVTARVSGLGDGVGEAEGVGEGVGTGDGTMDGLGTGAGTNTGIPGTVRLLGVVSVAFAWRARSSSPPPHADSMIAATSKAFPMRFWFISPPSQLEEHSYKSS